MNEFLSNRIERRYRCVNKEQLFNVLNKNFEEIFHDEEQITKVMTVYFNTKDGLDSEKTIRSKVYINDSFVDEGTLENVVCDLQVKLGNSKDGISVIKEKNTTYGKVLNQLKNVEKSDNVFESDIMEYIRKITCNQSLVPFMKIYYRRHYFVGKIGQHDIRITLDDHIVFENCLTNEKRKFSECVMEIKAEITKSFDEDMLASMIESIFKDVCIQKSTSKKIIGYMLIM